MHQNNKPHPVVKSCLITLALVLVYLIVAIPFKVMSVIPGFTDIRPVSMLQPIYGVFFGIPGCIAFAIGNLIGDCVSDSLKWSSIAGFASNFIAPFLFYIFWVRISKEAFSLRTGKSLLKQVAVTAVSAVVQAALITPAVVWIYPEVSGRVFASTVLLNSSVFPIMLGIPMLILMHEELGFKPKSHLKNLET